MNGRDGRVYPACAQGHVWRQSGNRTGHCSGCHRTFDGIKAFDRHQHIEDGRVTCLDPYHVRGADDWAYAFRWGTGMDTGTQYWRLRSEAWDPDVAFSGAGGRAGATNGPDSTTGEGDDHSGPENATGDPEEAA